MKTNGIVQILKRHSNLKNVAGMARFGISAKNTLGVSMPFLRGLAKGHRKDHALAIGLWKTGIHEARILAALVDDPDQVTEKQMEAWVKGFDSWDVCDQVCSNLFDKTPFAYAKAFEWAGRDEEFVKRAGFVLMAALSVHDKAAPDSKFKKFLPVIVRHSTDGRNFVRKAVNWALRQIGKRSKALNGPALNLARRLKKSKSPSARWVGSDAARELEMI